MSKYHLIAKVLDDGGEQLFWEAFEISLGGLSKKGLEKKLQDFIGSLEHPEEFEITLKVVKEKDKDA